MMYIEKVIIEGFKSFRGKIEVEHLSPSVNYLVGGNGSGKSNFFHAILFVISNLFHNLGPEDRKALLFDADLSAFVEIIFQDTKQVDKQVVRIKRTIDVKSDEYHLDGQHTVKEDVMTLLKKDGCSDSYPYCLVDQGKITSLVLMNNFERLNLLKEIGGLQVMGRS